jgi:hypothetical protein
VVAVKQLETERRRSGRKDDEKRRADEELETLTFRQHRRKNSRMMLLFERNFQPKATASACTPTKPGEN